MGGDGSAGYAAIAVYFRTPASLTACLDALREQSNPPTEIILIDNSSAIDARSERPAPGDDWRWVRARQNLGFGAACNLGAAMTRADYLLFLNADVALCPRACQRLCGEAAANPHTAVVGPRIYGADGKLELSARAFPSARTAALGRSSLLTAILGRFGHAPSGVSAALGASAVVDWVSGACMLIRRDAFALVGGFDERYWMYWEDADICRRLKDRGWETRLCADAVAYHNTGSSGRSERTIQAFHDSAAQYYERHVARNALMARLARALLAARMKVVLLRHARRSHG